jgi:hypothetical protein
LRPRLATGLPCFVLGAFEAEVEMSANCRRVPTHFVGIFLCRCKESGDLAK